MRYQPPATPSANVSAIASRLGRSLLLTGLLVGVPWALIVLVPVHLPGPPTIGDRLAAWWRAPSTFLGAVGDLLQHPITDTVVVHLLAVAAWLLWAAFALCVLTEIAALVSGVRAPTLPGLGGLQTAASWLLSGTLAGLLASSALLNHPIPRPSTDQTTVLTAARASTSADRPERQARLVYTVEPGDWLGAISHRFLGDYNAYGRIQRANRQLIPDAAGPDGPDHIEVGWQLHLPAGARDRGPEKHATGVTHQSSAKSSLTARLHAHVREKAPDSAQPAQSSPKPSSGADEQHDEQHTHEEHHDDGVAVGAGWISWPLATSLAALAGLVWLTRRRLYRYTEPFGYPEPADSDDREPIDDSHGDGHDDDLFRPGEDGPDTDVELTMGDFDDNAPPYVATRGRASRRSRSHGTQHDGELTREDLDADLQPIPAVLNRIRVLVRAHAEALAASSPTALPATDDSFKPLPLVESQQVGPSELSGLVGLAGTGGALPPVGPSGLQLAGLPAFPPEGLGLDGPGASDAARALLVAALSAGGPADPDAAGLVVTTFETLNSLLGGQAVVSIAGLPRLYVAADLDAALSVLDEELLSRRRTLDEHDAADLELLREEQPWSAPMPPVLLLAHTPAQDADPVRARLTTSLHLGAPLHVRGVLLGAWARGQTLTVDSAGQIRSHDEGTESMRIAVLDTAQTLDLLAVLTEVQTETPNVQPIAQRAVPDAPQPAPQPATSTAPPSVVASVKAGERVQIRVLGAPMILDRDGHAVPGLRAGATQLLVILAVHREGQQLMDIMEKIWPDATTRRAAQRLSTEAANLRRTVRMALGRTEDRTPETNAVINTGSFYRLNDDLLDVDVWQLQDQIAAAKATPDAGTRLERLRTAIDIYRGQLADGRDYPWSDVDRHQLHREVIRAHLHLADLITRSSPQGEELLEAAQLVEAAADLDPVSEDLAQRAIRASAAAGDTDAVRARLRVLRAALDEIDQEPTGDTIALAANITIAKEHTRSHSNDRRTPAREGGRS